MKKIILLLLLSVSVLSAEEYYLIKKQDYENLQHLYSQLGGIAIETGTSKRILPIIMDLRKIYYNVRELNNFNQYAIEKSSWSKDIDWDIVKKVVDDYKEEKNKLTIRDKLSILGGKINSLEMKLLNIQIDLQNNYKRK